MAANGTRNTDETEVCECGPPQTAVYACGDGSVVHAVKAENVFFLNCSTDRALLWSGHKPARRMLSAVAASSAAPECLGAARVLEALLPHSTSAPSMHLSNVWDERCIRLLTKLGRSLDAGVWRQTLAWSSAAWSSAKEGREAALAPAAVARTLTADVALHSVLPCIPEGTSCVSLQQCRAGAASTLALITPDLAVVSRNLHGAAAHDALVTVCPLDAAAAVLQGHWGREPAWPLLQAALQACLARVALQPAPPAAPPALAPSAPLPMSPFHPASVAAAAEASAHACAAAEVGHVAAAAALAKSRAWLLAR